MASDINRINPSQQVLLPTDPEKHNGQSSEKAVSPQAARQKAATQQAPIQVQSSLSAMIAEATDGDASEAMGRAALGMAKRDGVDEDGHGQVVVQEAVKPDLRAQAVQVPVHQDDMTTADTSKQTQVGGLGNDRGQAAIGVERTRTAVPDTSSLDDQHDQLMMLANTMSRRDLATFIAKKHAARLEAIFLGEAWKVTDSANLKLSAAQMPS